MGCVFEYCKEWKMKCWVNMAKIFMCIGWEIVIVVKEGGVDFEYNFCLCLVIQNVKMVNMLKVNVENVIKKVILKDVENYEELVYEGYVLYGVVFMVEMVMDNLICIVVSVCYIFFKYGGNLSIFGLVDYMFFCKANFKVKVEGQDGEELELGFIDFGLEELRKEDDKIVLVCVFEDYGNFQKGIEEFGLEVMELEFICIFSYYKEFIDSEVEDVIKLIEIMEDDDDVNVVFYNMKED